MSPRPPKTNGVIANPWNTLLAQKHALVRRAVRYALATVCDPSTGEPALTAAQVRLQLKHIQINANASGDNIVIPALAGVKEIYEVVMWNVTAQNCQFQQGLTGANPIVLLNLPGFPSLTGFVLGFNGNFSQPHWEVDNGQALVLNLQNGTQVTGFIRYRVANGNM